MRIREIKKDVPVTPEYIEKNSWNHTFKIRTITPIYGGGVKAGYVDREMPIRASGIRGQLRFWWRLLQRNTDRSSKEIFEKERNLWGGMCEGGEDFSSKVQLRIMVDKSPFPTNDDRSYPAYATFPLREQMDDQGQERDSSEKKLIKENFEFLLKIQVPSEFKDELTHTLRWWGSFGGIGARTRRGMGSVKIVCEDNQLLKPVNFDEVEQLGCKLVVHRTESENPMDTWDLAINRLSKFRGRDNIGRSYWPEADAIRNITISDGHFAEKLRPRPEMIGLFPKAVLGLPILFKFKDPKDPVLTELSAYGKTRMASPLIIKTMALENDSFGAIVLKLPTSHLDTLDLSLTEMEAPQDNWKIEKTGGKSWWPTSEQIKIIKNRHSEFPMGPNHENAIDAFLVYFRR